MFVIFFARNATSHRVWISPGPSMTSAQLKQFLSLFRICRLLAEPLFLSSLRRTRYIFTYKLSNRD